MMPALGCWAAAMVSGLCWAPRWTALFSGATLALAVAGAPQALSTVTGWLHLVLLGGTPWLLVLQQADDRLRLRQLQAKEARQMTRLSETVRSLLALQGSMQVIEDDITEITEVYHVTKETSRALHPDELFAALAESLPRSLATRQLRLVDFSQTPPRSWSATRPEDGAWVVEPPAPLAEGERTLVERARAAQPPTQVQPQDGAAWAPLWRDRQCIGLLSASHLAAEDHKTLSMVADQLSLQMARIHLYGQVEALAITDSLTGLSVRRYFLERAHDELVRCQRHHLSCSLVMGDLDLFKQKNDTYGHLVGDVILKEVATILRKNLRDVDLIARYGGEEFILMLVETNVDSAMPIAERLRQLVEVQRIQAYDEILTQTISLGLAGYPQDGKTLEALIEQADQALLGAKRRGRNCVLRAGTTPPPRPASGRKPSRPS